MLVTSNKEYYLQTNGALTFIKLLYWVVLGEASYQTMVSMLVALLRSMCFCSWLQVPVSTLALTSLYGGAWLGSVSQINQFLSNCFWSVFCHISSQTRTVSSFMSAVSLTQLRDSWEEEIQPRNCLDLTSLWPCLSVIFLIANCCGRTQHTVVPSSQAGGPGMYKKSSWASLRNQASRQCCSVISASAPAHRRRLQLHSCLPSRWTITFTLK